MDIVLKQNITRDIEIKNKLTVTGGVVGGNNGGKGGRVFRNNYKGHLDKSKGGGWDQGREVGITGVGGVMEGKCRQLYLNDNKKIKLGRKCRQL